MDGYRGLRAWKWLFIIEGVVTIVVAFGAFFVLPNFPRTTMWLSEEERQLAVWRLEEDIGQDDWTDSKDQTFWHGAKLAFMDIKTYVLVEPPPIQSMLPCRTLYADTRYLRNRWSCFSAL